MTPTPLVPVPSESSRRETELLRSTRSRLLLGYATSAFFAVGIVGYASIAGIRGAVIAQGNMVVEGNLWV